MTKYIIVKYAEDHFPEGKGHISHSVWNTYSAKQIGIEKEYYSSQKEAQEDLAKLREFNPAVYYGVIEAFED